MKKYLGFSALAALCGCSALLGGLAASKEITLPEIEGIPAPAALANKTFIPSGSYDASVRFTNGYVSFKGREAFESYAAKILAAASASDPYKLYITDGSSIDGHYAYTALYIKAGANNMYEIGTLTNRAGTNTFPPLADLNSPGSREDSLSPAWYVDEKFKPNSIPAEYRGKYTGTSPQPGGSIETLTITEDGFFRDNDSDRPTKILRMKDSGGLELYSSGPAYKIVNKSGTYEIYLSSSSGVGGPARPDTDATFMTTGTASYTKK